LLTALVVAASAASAVGWVAAHPSAAATPRQRPAASSSPLRAVYTGVSPCDLGAVIVRQAQMTLPVRLRLGARSFRAGTIVGTVSLRFSPRCALAWTRFIPAPPFRGNVGGILMLQSRRVADGATSTLRLHQIVAAEGDPLLTIPGCVVAEATATLGPGKPTLKAATTCFQ
jgi:hypothetical protein